MLHKPTYLSFVFLGSGLKEKSGMNQSIALLFQATDGSW